MDARTLRRLFFHNLFAGLKLVWPILSVVIGTIVGLGFIVGAIEHWSVGDSIYFAFITGLTIGYGDFAPQSPVSRLLAVFIGLCGLLITGGIAAVAVKAFPESEASSDPGANPNLIPNRPSKIQS